MSRSIESSPVAARLFVVGTPRSGTTLLQSMLAAHPDIHSLPETHFFARSVPRGRVKRALGLVGQEQRAFARERLADLGCSDQGGWRFASWARAFQRHLDRQTVQEGKRVWLEKTPQHLHRIDWISATIDSPRFVHMLRNGQDVVASMYEVTHKHPDVWGGARSIGACVERWLGDVALSLAYRGQAGHLLVSYERLVADPAAVLTAICDLARLPYSEAMIAGYREAYRERVAEAGAEWTAGVDGKLAAPSSRKFDVVLDEAQRRQVTAAIEDAGYADIATLV